MTNKALKSIKKALKEFDTDLEKELNRLDIDPEKLLQAFYVFIGDTKYTLKVSRSPEKYIYKVTLISTKKVTACYIAKMVFDVFTGNTKITNTYMNNIGSEA